MYGKEQVAIVIPIYKEKLTVTEKIALSQILKLLKQYDIFYVLPQTLKYEYKYENIKEIQFDDVWFSCLRKYSELMLQKEFYESFVQYEYILVYQLDAFVFTDDLHYFCDWGYDYIGAPWIHGLTLYKDAKHILHYVGNGGLSLRKVSAFIEWLEQVDLTKYIETVNEDILIAAFGPPMLKIPSVEEALRFSFDMAPRGCFEKNNYKLPFGCHAWQKIDMDFWRPFIEAEGYDLHEVPSSVLFERYQKRYEAEDIQKRLLMKLSSEALIIPLMNKLTEGERLNLYIWGTGVWGTFVGRIFSEYKIRIEGFIDNREQDITGHLGYPMVLGKEVLKQWSPDIKFFIAVQQSDEIEEQLQSAGYIHEKDYLLLKDLDE